MEEENKTESKLALALSKAQGQMENARKESDNPWFKSRYADLASVWGACRKPLADNGLAVVQTFKPVQYTPQLRKVKSDKTGIEREVQYGLICVVTTLLHSSGESISSELIIPAVEDAQGFGSAATYARRYALAAMVGIAPAEDDGEAAMGRLKADFDKKWEEKVETDPKNKPAFAKKGFKAEKDDEGEI